MSLPTSGPISISDINRELGFDFNFQNSLGSSFTRTLFGTASGSVALAANGRGKSNTFTFNKTISSNTQNYNLLNDMIANGYTNGNPFVVNVIVNSGVYVWSDDITLAGFDTGAITGTGTINIINNGFIIGRGGNGGDSWVGSGVTANPVQSGGPAINLQKPVSITNNSYIAGGGGGGAGGPTSASSRGGGGGGAGGGVGGRSWTTVTVNGGNGGAVGSSGVSVSNGGGGGGGRILPGTGGVGIEAYSSPLQGHVYVGGAGGGAGGAGGSWAFSGTTSGAAGSTGGSGGSSSNAGANAVAYVQGGPGPYASGAGGGGGGWGASGGTGRAGAVVNSVVGTGGRAVNLNGNSVTWVATGTRYGAIA